MVRAGTSRWRRSFTGIEDGVERPGVKAADSGVGGGGTNLSLLLAGSLGSHRNPTENNGTRDTV